MGLHSLPPGEGVLCIILVNTAISIKIFKAFIHSILHAMGIHLSSQYESIEQQTEFSEFRLPPSETFIQEFRKKVPTIQFGSVFNTNMFDQECLVCLNRFEHNSVVNHLCCGHVFHKVCLEKWLDYWNITCPLCRTRLMPEEEDDPPCIDRVENDFLGHFHECY